MNKISVVYIYYTGFEGGFDQCLYTTQLDFVHWEMNYIPVPIKMWISTCSADAIRVCVCAVSYTHLTLPTIDDV